MTLPKQQKESEILKCSDGGWRDVALGEVAEINPRFNRSLAPQPEEDVSFIPMAAVCEHRCTIKSTELRPYREVSKGFTSMSKNDLIIAKITPCFENGKVAHLHSIPTHQAFGSTEFHVVRAFSATDARLLYHLLRAPFLNQAGKSQMKGAAGQKRVPPDFLRNFKFRIPCSLAEQKRIAGILDAADGLREKRRQTLDDLDSLIQSTFLTMFGDPVTNPMGWEVRPLNDSLDAIESGWSPKCETRKVTGSEWGVLKLGAITWCHYNDNENKALPVNLKPRPKIEVRVGDLLFARKNTHELVAACALVSATRSRLMLPDLIFRLRLQSNTDLEKCFLWQLLVNAHQRKSIQKLAGGAAGSMPNISKAKLRTVKLIRPPLALQQEFASIVESIEAQKSRCRAHLDELDTLFAALQTRAFKGEL